MADAAAIDADRDSETVLTDDIKWLIHCSVCLERFTRPKCLPCQHTFCEECLDSVMVNNSYMDHVPCPQCRTDHTLSRAAISNLPNNLTIMGLMEITPVTPDRGKCPGCTVRTIRSELSRCPHCDGVICASCRTSHSSQIRDALLISAQHLHGYVEHLFKQRNIVKAGIHKSQQNCESTKTAIKEHVGRITLELREREKNLCQQVDEHASNVASQLEVEIGRLEADLATTLSTSTSVDAELGNVMGNLQTNITVLMAISEQVTNYNDEHQNLPASVQERANLDATFLPMKTEELNQAILEFGEVKIGAVLVDSVAVASIGDESVWGEMETG